MPLWGDTFRVLPGALRRFSFFFPTVLLQLSRLNLRVSDKSYYFECSMFFFII